MAVTTLPLAAAAERLRGKPGRPRKQPAPQADPPALSPRLLDLADAAVFLSVSSWTLRDLLANGTISRVRVPLPGGGGLRKILVDRQDLERVIEVWKDRPAEVGQ